MSLFDEEALFARLRDEVRRVVREELDRGTVERGSPPVDGPEGAEFVTVERAGEIASVHEATARKWIRSGALRRYSAGSSPRVRLSELYAYLGRAPETQRSLDLDSRADEILARPPRRKK